MTPPPSFPPPVGIFTILGDTYLTVERTTIELHSLPTRLGIVAKRVVVFDSPEHVAGGTAAIPMPSEYTLRWVLRNGAYALPPDPWTPCRHPTAGLVAVATRISLDYPELATVVFGQADVEGRSIRRDENDDWVLSIGHLDPVTLVDDLPGSSENILPVEFVVRQERLTGYLVNPGDYHVVVLTGENAPQSPDAYGGNLPRLLRHFWDDWMLADSESGRRGDVAAERVRTNLLTDVATACDVLTADRASVDFIEIDRETREIRSRSYDGALGVPIRGSYNGAIASTALAYHLKILSPTDGPVTVRAALASDPADHSFSSVKVKYDTGTGWTVTSRCEPVSMGSLLRAEEGP